MGFFGFFQKKRTKQSQTDIPTFSATIQYGNYTSSSPKMQIREQTGIDFGTEEYVCISTAGDENVCPMCAQFEGKFFLKKDAPTLPLCPSCSCDYMYYDKQDLPSSAVISSKEDFIFPAKCASLFYKHQQDVYNEKDTEKIIRICERDLKKLPELMAPYFSAGFPAPAELVCRDFLPDLYMQLGEWNKAEKVIKKCIETNAYSPNDGSTELDYLMSYRKVASETLSYIQQTLAVSSVTYTKLWGIKTLKRNCLNIFSVPVGKLKK